MYENLLNRVPHVSFVLAWFTCPHANVRNACQRANKRANEPKVCQLFNLACQRAKGMPSFQLGVQTAWIFFIAPKGMSNFQTFVLLHQKFYIIGVRIFCFLFFSSKGKYKRPGFCTLLVKQNKEFV